MAQGAAHLALVAALRVPAAEFRMPSQSAPMETQSTSPLASSPPPFLRDTVLSRTNNHFSVVLMAAVAPSHFTSDKLSYDSGPVDVISCRFDQCWFQTVLRGICH